MCVQASVRVHTWESVHCMYGGKHTCICKYAPVCIHVYIVLVSVCVDMHVCCIRVHKCAIWRDTCEGLYVWMCKLQSVYMQMCVHTHCRGCVS